MSTTRRDVQFKLTYDAADDSFAVDLHSQIDFVDDTTNRTFADTEVVRLEYADFSAAEQALGSQFIAMLQSIRDAKVPLILPPQVP